MTVYLPILIELFFWVLLPIGITSLVFLRREAKFRVNSLDPLKALALTCLLAVIFLIPGAFTGLMVSCSIHPAQDCEHYHDPCLREAWRLEIANHSCPGLT